MSLIIVIPNSSYYQKNTNAFICIGS